jgi:hypothetical protein
VGLHTAFAKYNNRHVLLSRTGLTLTQPQPPNSAMTTTFKRLCHYMDEYGVDVEYQPCVFDISPEGEKLILIDNLYRLEGRVVYEEERMEFSLAHLDSLCRTMQEAKSEDGKETELEIECSEKMIDVIWHMCDENHSDVDAESEDPHSERDLWRANQKSTEREHAQRMQREREEYDAQRAAEEDPCAGKRSRDDSDGESRRPRVEV